MDSARSGCIAVRFCHTQMTRRPGLSINEQKRVLQLRGEGQSYRKIAAKLGRGKTVIGSFLANPFHYNTVRHHRTRTKLTESQKKRIRVLLGKGSQSCSKLVWNLNLPVCRQTVWRYLASCDRFTYGKMKKTLDLTDAHKQARLDFARAHMPWELEWSTVIFSDEKQFNLDGPDGLKFYWKDSRGQEKSYISRHSGGGSVLVWGAISALGKTSLAVLHESVTGPRYVQTLEDYLLPYSLCVHDDAYIFMQDNAGPHRSGVVSEWFKETDVEVLPWPSRSPDLNPIENIWGALARMVYADGRQYKTVAALEHAIVTSWDNISLACVQRHIQSMPKRCVDLVKSDGGKISY